MFSEKTSSSPVDSIRFDIIRHQALMDAQVQIRLLDCAPNQRITLAAQKIDDGGWHWTSRANFQADATGTVDLAAQAPLEGSYAGIDPMGMFWSMTPDARKRGMDYFNQLHPYQTTFTAGVAESYEHAGHLLPIPNLPTRLPAFLAGMLGGTPQGNAHAATNGWSQMLRFLQEHFA